MKFSIFYSVSNYGEHNGSLSYAYDKAIETALLAEELGFDGIFFNEGHSSAPNYRSSNSRLLIGSLSKLTKRIELGVAIVGLGLLDPRLVAEDAIMLDSLTQGRLALGLAAGHKPHFPQFGLNPKYHKEIYNLKLKMFDAYLNGDSVSIKSDIISANNSKLGIQPEFPDLRHRIFQGTVTQSGAQIIGNMGYRMAYTPPHKPSLGNIDFRKELPAVTYAYQQSWQNSQYAHLQPYPIMVQLPCHLTYGDEDIFERIGDQFDIYWQSLIPGAVEKHLYLRRYIQDHLSLLGDEVLLKERLTRIHSSGISHCMCQFNFGGMSQSLVEESIRRFAKIIMPFESELPSVSENSINSKKYA